MQSAGVRIGVHAEFVSEHLAQLMVGAQRRGGVAVGSLRLHEQSVARLGERRFAHKRSGGSLSGRQLLRAARAFGS